MARRTISTAVDTDGELYADFEEFEARYETRAEAVRAALRAGIDAKTEDEQGSNDDRDELELPSTLRGWSLFALGFLTAALTSPGVLVVLLAGAVVWSVGGASLAYPLAAVAGGWLVGRAALPALVRRLSRDSVDVEAGARAFHRGAD